MKKLITLAVAVLLLLGGCSAPEKKDEFADADVYYAQMVMIYDSTFNMQHFYVSATQDFTNTAIYLKGDKFKLEWYDGEVLSQSVHGTMSSDKPDEATAYYDVVLAGSEVKPNIVISKKDGQITLVQYIVNCGQFYGGITFEKEKKELGETIGKDIRLLADGKLEDDNFKEKAGFMDSECYKEILDSCEALYGSIFKVKGDFDNEKNILYLNLYSPDGTAYLLAKGDKAFVDSWNTVTSNMHEVTPKYDVMAQILRYKEVTTAIMVHNDEDENSILYATYKGKVLYDAASDKNFISKRLQREKQPAGTNPTYFTNKYGTPETKCHHSGCNNYIASSGNTWDCEKHANKCLNCGMYIDCDALYCLDCLEKALVNSGTASEKFTNKYGTADTKCHHSGCNNLIARSGNTWDCPVHANKCLNCGMYIDCDAMYCMDCLYKSVSGSKKQTCVYINEDGTLCGAPVTTYATLCDKHYNELWAQWGEYIEH